MTGSWLRELSVFQGLDEERLALLEGCLEERRLGPNEIVFRQNDPCDGLYVLARGGVVIRSEVAGQPIERVRDVARGELFGEIEALESVDRLFSARTLGEATVLRIGQERVRELLADHPLVETLLRHLLLRRRTARLRAMLAPSTRHEPRIWIDREVLVSAEGEERATLRLENLSGGGACFAVSPHGWRVAQPLDFALGMDDRPALLRASATVRWRHGDSVGVAFDAAGPAHRRRVAQALRDLADPMSPMRSPRSAR